MPQRFLHLNNPSLNKKKTPVTPITMGARLDDETVLNILLANIRFDSNVVTERVAAVGGLTNNDRIIFLMGPPGSGRNTFMEVLSGTEVNGLQHPQAFASAIRLSVPNRNPADPSIVLVNNPAFNDEGQSDMNTLRVISSWLQNAYQGGIHVSGAIFFHRITDEKLELEGMPLRNWRVFEKICGDYFKNVVIATTMWGDVDGEAGGTRDHELHDFLSKRHTRGWTTHHFTRVNRSSAADILRPILENLNRSNLSLKQTSAARALYSELGALKNYCEQQQEDIINDLNAVAINDRDKAKALIVHLQKSKALSIRAENELHNLKETGRERFQRLLLQTPGLGSVLRSVGWPNRPVENNVLFA
jgi:hypothetical protein